MTPPCHLVILVGTLVAHSGLPHLKSSMNTSFRGIAVLRRLRWFLAHCCMFHFISMLTAVSPLPFRLQRPNTFCYRLTMESTVTQGHHIYMSSCAQSTAQEIVHSFVGRYTVVNELHYNTAPLLHRLLCASVSFFIDGTFASGKSFNMVSLAYLTSHQYWSGLPLPVHVMDVTKVDGLLDMIAVGNVIEFAVALDYRTYQGPSLHEADSLERDASMTCYRTFITWFSHRYGLIIDGAWVNPTYLFRRQLISFAASLIDYFTREHSAVQGQDRVPSPIYGSRSLMPNSRAAVLPPKSNVAAFAESSRD